MPELPGEDDPLYRVGVMLLNGWGYNWYRLDNQIRADDQLIRSRASEHLSGVIAWLREREAGYRRAFLPPPTREHPDPDPQHLAAVHRFQAVEARISELETRVRGAALPPDDKVWRRHRDELDTLRRLGECDAVLVGGARELADVVSALPAEAALDTPAVERIDRCLMQLRAVLGRRGEILAALV
jgi:hypothetical protein